MSNVGDTNQSGLVEDIKQVSEWLGHPISPGASANHLEALGADTVRQLARVFTGLKGIEQYGPGIREAFEEFMPVKLLLKWTNGFFVCTQKLDAIPDTSSPEGKRQTEKLVQLRDVVVQTLKQSIAVFSQDLSLGQTRRIMPCETGVVEVLFDGHWRDGVPELMAIAEFGRDNKLKKVHGYNGDELRKFRDMGEFKTAIFSTFGVTPKIKPDPLVAEWQMNSEQPPIASPHAPATSRLEQFVQGLNATGANHADISQVGLSTPTIPMTAPLLASTH